MPNLETQVGIWGKPINRCLVRRLNHKKTVRKKNNSQKPKKVTSDVGTHSVLGGVHHTLTMIQTITY